MIWLIFIWSICVIISYSCFRYLGFYDKIKTSEFDKCFFFFVSLFGPFALIVLLMVFIFAYLEGKTLKAKYNPFYWIGRILP